MNSLIQNYINGNLSEAKKRAKRHTFMEIVTALREEYGYSAPAVLAVTAYLKNQGTFQAACDAEAAQKDRQPL